MKIEIKKSGKFNNIIHAMGVVFGDIGTSPIYTLSIVFTLTLPTKENIFGILSLIFWTLIMLVTVQYAWLAMSLSIRGEGGIIVLKEILSSLLKKGRRVGFIAFLGYIGVSLLIGDGVITPAISILSAVEGLKLIPQLSKISLTSIILITFVITILLFTIQHRGTDKVAASFGPIMFLWFFSLFFSGFFYLIHLPNIFLALSPLYAIKFFIHNGLPGFFVLSEVILCATGGEALYADMGHLGAKPIRQAWSIVFFALIINYFGQGAYILEHNDTEQVLFKLVSSFSEVLYIPFLILTLLATIIASQAMISAVMSLVFQGINIGIFPLMKIKFTSQQLRSQIYIPAVNKFLLFAVLLMILVFKESHNLAAAYGLAVTATMFISSIFIVTIFFIKKNYVKSFIGFIVLIITGIYFVAVTHKIPYGGYWSVIIAIFVFGVMMLWINGMTKLRRFLRATSLDIFVESFKQIYETGNYIKGEAIFFTKNITSVSPYILHCMFRTGIIYEKNILVSVETSDKPYGVNLESYDKVTDGLYTARIIYGYMESPDLPKLFKQWGFSEKAIFYGAEELKTSKPFLKIFAILKRLAPNWISFFDFPYNKLHGVVTRIEI
ncbi:MAG: KUP/HAK/KT family potassium transporter [Ignavibacterium sp.]|uniref:KUP/HAK/KT family potassium transporter n=1 Tax=Ignavibacterium sp. TaxID=2651167 RepID=UPI00404AB7EE